MRVQKSNKLTSMVFLLALLNLFVACGSDSDDESPAPQQQEEAQQDDQGSYQAVLTPLNTNVAGTSSGTVTVRIRGDEVEAEVEVDGAPGLVAHPQYIYTGRECPPGTTDTNGDGFLDFVEAHDSFGFILIPLDNQLNTQSSGGVFPVANNAGNYTYTETASLTSMYADLKAPDPVAGDYVTKLGPQENLNLEGRSVVIHGVSNLPPLPPTVASDGQSPANSTLPIACGKLVRIAETEEPPAPTPTPPSSGCPVETEFSTRLSNELLISGTECRGGETTQVIDEDGSVDTFTCGRGQWLVTIDNVNTCTADGACTEAFVFPVIANLRRAINSNPPEQCTYNMVPDSPTSSEQREILDEHQARFFDEEAPRVIQALLFF